MIKVTLRKGSIWLGWALAYSFYLVRYHHGKEHGHSVVPEQ